MERFVGRMGWVVGVLFVAGCGKSVSSVSGGEGAPSDPPVSPEPLNVACTRAGWTDPKAAVAAGFADDALVFLLADGSEKIVDRNPSFRTLWDSYWSIGKDSVAIAHEGARLYDRSGALLAEARDVTHYLPAIHADGSVSVDLSRWDETRSPRAPLLDGVLLRPDGRVFPLPFFADEPDENGWVVAKSVDGDGFGQALVNARSNYRMRPVLEPYVYSNTTHLGTRFFYVTRTNDELSLVDQSLGETYVTRLGPWPEEDTPRVYLSPSSSFVFVAVRNVPSFRYDLERHDARPLSPVAEAVDYLDGYRVPAPGDWMLMTVPGSARRSPVWSFDPVSGRVGDQSTFPYVPDANLEVLSSEDWAFVLADGVPIWRVDRGTGAIGVLELGELPAVEARTVNAGETAVVVSDGLPRTSIDLGSSAVRAIQTDGLEHAPDIATDHGWVVGARAGVPLWRLDAKTGAASSVPPLPPGLTAAPWPTPTLREDGALGIVALEERYAAHYLVLEPGETAWRSIAYPVQSVSALDARPLKYGWTLIANSLAYGSISDTWTAAPADAGPILVGDSEQLVALDGTLLYEATISLYQNDPPPYGIVVDPSESCALADGTALIDLATGERRDIPIMRGLKWFAPR